VATLEDSSDPALLAELVRESERVVDWQVKAFERAEDKSDRLMSLALAVLGGGLAIGAIVNADGPPAYGAIALGLVAGAACLNLTSLVFFLRASPGLLEQHDVRPGPAPRALSRRSLDNTWTLEDHYLDFLRSMADCHIENAANLARAVLGRRRGLRLLLCAIAAYALALLLIAAAPKVV
jgi:hypothetical protein